MTQTPRPTEYEADKDIDLTRYAELVAMEDRASRHPEFTRVHSYNQLLQWLAELDESTS